MGSFLERNGRFVYRGRSPLAMILGVSAGLGVMSIAAVVFFLAKQTMTGPQAKGDASAVFPIIGAVLLLDLLVTFFVVGRLRSVNSLEIDQMERTLTYFELKTSPAGFQAGGRRRTISLDTAEGCTVSEATTFGTFNFGGRAFSLDLVVQGERIPVLRLTDRAETESVAREFSTLTGITLR
jgi:hypothetical protein